MDKVTITLMHVMGEFAFDVQSTVVCAGMGINSNPIYLLLRIEKEREEMEVSPFSYVVKAPSLKIIHGQTLEKKM